MILNTATIWTLKSFLPIAWLKSAVSLKIVSFVEILLNVDSIFYLLNLNVTFSPFWNLPNDHVCLNYQTDKKNENKEVAVDEFLPATKAYEAIQNSM